VPNFQLHQGILWWYHHIDCICNTIQLCLQTLSAFIHTTLNTRFRMLWTGSLLTMLTQFVTVTTNKITWASQFIVWTIIATLATVCISTIKTSFWVISATFTASCQHIKCPFKSMIVQFQTIFTFRSDNTLLLPLLYANFIVCITIWKNFANRTIPSKCIWIKFSP